MLPLVAEEHFVTSLPSKHYFMLRAIEARQAAEEAEHPAVRRSHTIMADSYERLASINDAGPRRSHRPDAKPD